MLRSRRKEKERHKQNIRPRIIVRQPNCFNSSNSTGSCSGPLMSQSCSKLECLQFALPCLVHSHSIQEQITSLSIYLPPGITYDTEAWRTCWIILRCFSWL